LIKVFSTLPCIFLFSIAVFFDFDLIFSFSTTQGLSRSTTAISASLPIDKFPALIFNIFAGLQV